MRHRNESKVRSWLGVGPGLADADVDLERHRQLVDVLHLVLERGADGLGELGRRLEHELVVHGQHICTGQLSAMRSVVAASRA